MATTIRFGTKDHSKYLPTTCIRWAPHDVEDHYFRPIIAKGNRIGGVKARW